MVEDQRSCWNLADSDLSPRYISHLFSFANTAGAVALRLEPASSFQNSETCSGVGSLEAYLTLCEVCVESPFMGGIGFV
jgi:hypothetical protein